MPKSALEKALAKLPSSKVYIGKDGRVRRVENWVLWGLEPWMTVMICRTEKGFRSSISDDHKKGPSGGATNTEGGTLEEATAKLREGEIRKSYIDIFLLDQATEEAIRSLGYRKHVILFDA
jgi:hypothetical protein